MKQTRHIPTARRSKAIMVFVACVLEAGAALARPSSPGSDQRSFDVRDLEGLGAAGVAKEICSAVFVSNRDPSEFLEASSKFWMVPEEKEGLQYEIDENERVVTLSTQSGAKGEAVFIGKNGCVAYGPSGEKPGFPYEPLPAMNLEQHLAWPIGDQVWDGEPPSGINMQLVAEAVETAFDEASHTLAFVVIYKGKIVAERYGKGLSATTRLPGWSMTKTLQSTLVGRLEMSSGLGLFNTVNIPEWGGEQDPRAATTHADLMRMSAPISCGNGDPQFDYLGWRRDGYPYYLYTFSGPDDAYDYSTSRPVLEEGKPRGYYANCQPHVLGRALQVELEASEDSILSFAERELFEPLGMRSVVMEHDRKGNFLTAGYSLATARDWGRLGLLYLNDGIAPNGERLLSPEFLSFVRSPAPHWEKPIYGGQVWLRLSDCSSWACDTFQMNGIEGQRVMIVPSKDLVVVRLGDGAGDPPSPDPDRTRHAVESLDAAGAILMDAVDGEFSSDEQQIVSTLHSFFKALGKGDQESFGKVVTAEFRIFEDGEVWDGTKTLQAVNGTEEWIRRWTLSQLEVGVSSDRAVVTYRNTLRAERNPSTEVSGSEPVRVREWLESANLVKSGDAWKIEFLHSTSIPQAR